MSAARGVATSRALTAFEVEAIGPSTRARARQSTGEAGVIRGEEGRPRRHGGHTRARCRVRSPCTHSNMGDGFCTRHHRLQTT